MFHAGNGPNTSTGNAGIVVDVEDVDVDDVDSGDVVVVVGPYGIDVVVTPGTDVDVVVVVVDPSVVVVVDEDSGGSVDTGGSVTGGSVDGGAVEAGTVGAGSVTGGSVDGGAWAPAEKTQAPGAGTNTAAMTTPTSSLIDTRVAGRENIRRPAT